MHRWCWIKKQKRVHFKHLFSHMAQNDDQNRLKFKSVVGVFFFISSIFSHSPSFYYSIPNVSHIEALEMHFDRFVHCICARERTRVKILNTLLNSSFDAKDFQWIFAFITQTPDITFKWFNEFDGDDRRMNLKRMSWMNELTPYTCCFAFLPKQKYTSQAYA